MGKKPAKGANLLPPPNDLQVEFLEHHDVELAVLSFAWSAPALPPELTDSERDVVEGVLRGWSNARIAASRGRAVRTIANQLASVYRKLGVRSRTELIARHGRG